METLISMNHIIVFRMTDVIASSVEDENLLDKIVNKFDILNLSAIAMIALFVAFALRGMYVSINMPEAVYLQFKDWYVLIISVITSIFGTYGFITARNGSE